MSAIGSRARPDSASAGGRGGRAFHDPVKKVAPRDANPSRSSNRHWRDWPGPEGWLALAVAAVPLAAMVAGCAGGTTPGSRPASPAPRHHVAGRPISRHASQAPLPVSLRSLQMVSARAGWALRWTGNPGSPAPTALALARSTDGGRTWTDVTPAAAKPMLTSDNSYAVLLARTADRAWLAVTLARSESDYGVTPHRTEVFGTVDGGRSWTRSAPIRAPGYAGWLDFTDPANGWLMQDLGAAMQQSHVQLYRTTDGGRHWSRSAETLPWPQTGTGPSGLPVSCDKTGIAFATPKTGWITAGCFKLSDALRVTHDGGRHWAAQRLPIPAAACMQSECDVSPPRFFGSTGFLLVGRYPGASYLLVSRDTGATWHPTGPLPPGAGAYPQIQFFDRRRGLLMPAGTQADFGRTCYATSDGGRTWTPVRQGRPFRQLGISFDFVSPSAGFAWILGSDATSPVPIYATADGGRTWNSFIPLG